MEKGVPDAGDVPEGFCRKGCGRKVAPGVTDKGKPFRTCCRGCVMGFGHDLHCGNIDPELLGPGKCRNGCGRPVNPGKTVAGRPYATCCRGCVHGKHDATCGEARRSASDLEAGHDQGMCKMGCGRKVAEPKDDRKFRTCCRGCASGLGHSAGCVE